MPRKTTLIGHAPAGSTARIEAPGVPAVEVKADATGTFRVVYPDVDGFVITILPPPRRVPLRRDYPESPLRAAVEALGGLIATASVCGVATYSVQNWLKAGGVPKLVDAVTLADAVGIDVRTLRVIETDASEAPSRSPE